MENSNSNSNSKSNSNSNSNSKSNSNSRKLQRNKNRMMMLERGVVGLSIVAAMNITKTSSTHDADIVSSANKAAANFRGTTTYALFFASTLNKIGGTHHHFVSRTSYFLSSCNLCNKHLHGVDIFIYRGERAFCSAECRETHIRKNKDECYYREKCRTSGLMKPPLHSIPPCSPPSPFSLPGIAAA